MSDDCIVCCIARNEELYLDEWISHYLSLGFARIIINDNNDDPNQLKEFLRDKPYRENVKINPWNGEVNLQLNAYRSTYVQEEFKWCAFFDIDEFLELPQHDDIKSYLSMFPDDAGSILIHWLHYGTNGHRNYEALPVTKRFKYPSVPCFREPSRNYHTKCIVRKVDSTVAQLIMPDPHVIRLSSPYKLYINNATVVNSGVTINYDYAILKHYATKSLEEFVKRNMSGDRCGNNEDDKYIHNLKRFVNLDSNIENIDQLIISCMLIDGSKWEPFKNILVRSADIDIILSTLKHGKNITLAGPDKSGNLLCLCIDIASVNGVNKLSWKFDTSTIDHSKFDVIVD